MNLLIHAEENSVIVPFTEKGMKVAYKFIELLESLVECQGSSGTHQSASWMREKK